MMYPPGAPRALNYRCILQADETRGTGCGHDNAWVWGAEACPVVDEGCHLIACGSTANGCASEDPRCAVDEEEHEVSCCADTDVTPDDGVNDWVTGGNARALCADRGIWGFRRPDGTNGSCNHAATYEAAAAWCADNGGRLCTADEINADCTRGTGCSHDGDLMWTSSQQVGSGHKIAIGASNQAAGGGANCPDECTTNACTCTARCMADDDITAAVRCCADAYPGCALPFDGVVAKLSFEESDAHLNAGDQHQYVDYGDDYNNRLASTIVPHTLLNDGQFNPVRHGRWGHFHAPRTAVALLAPLA
jgi:hypothetical protein